MRELPNTGTAITAAVYKPEFEVETGLSPEEFSELTDAPHHLSRGFHIHPKVKKLLEQRAEMGAGKRPVDYGMAEALAFASLVKAGTHVRISADKTPAAALSTSATPSSSTSKTKTNMCR